MLVLVKEVRDVFTSNLRKSNSLTSKVWPTTTLLSHLSPSFAGFHMKSYQHNDDIYRNVSSHGKFLSISLMRIPFVMPDIRALRVSSAHCVTSIVICPIGLVDGCALLLNIDRPTASALGKSPRSDRCAEATNQLQREST